MSEEIDPDTGMPVNPMFPKKQYAMHAEGVALADGERMLLIRFQTGEQRDGKEEWMVFTIKGEQLASFYELVKKIVEGDRRPSYLG